MLYFLLLFGSRETVGNDTKLQFYFLVSVFPFFFFSSSSFNVDHLSFRCSCRIKRAVFHFVEKDLLLLKWCEHEIYEMYEFTCFIFSVGKRNG